MINIGHTADAPFAPFDNNGLPPHLHILARDAVHLPHASATTTDSTSISAISAMSAMSAALWQFVRVRLGTRLGPHGMDVFNSDVSDRGRGGKDAAEYRHANAHVPPPRSPHDDEGSPASAAARSTADGGTNA
ncbi:hypothetical protein [Streptomyces sioyaensis]|uniref:hypothetical protein n=1 Tax=Streptomyces sioyaensis TaxID=67364 RepID=UPI003789DD81